MKKPTDTQSVEQDTPTSTHRHRVTFFLAAMRIIRPFLGPEKMCVFPYYSCTEFAADQLKYASLPVAMWRILLRILSCNPITPLILHLRSRRQQNLKQAEQPSQHSDQQQLE